jgi:peroxiredoxin family protein
MSEQQRQQEVHIVLVSNDPNRAYPAFTLALGAVTMGEVQAILYYERIRSCEERRLL